MPGPTPAEADVVSDDLDARRRRAPAAGLGLHALELDVLLSDVDADADELLSALARRRGFANAYERVVDALVQ